jgi:hypothetical protein
MATLVASFSIRMFMMDFLGLSPNYFFPIGKMVFEKIRQLSAFIDRPT